MKRTELLTNETQGTFDVLVVGGGISGAWIAFYASLAGYKTALIEADDFGARTSSASSKVLHGGIRYLQQLNFSKVRESSLERAYFMSCAPHVAKPVDFLVPTFAQLAKSKFLLNCAMGVYELLGWGQHKILAADNIDIPARRSLNSDQLNEKIPLFHLDHTGAIAYPEFHIQDTERTVWSVVNSARECGATVANYISARGYRYSGRRIKGIRAYSILEKQMFDIDASIVINAAGPWVDELNRTCSESSDDDLALETYIPRFARGLHLVTRPLSNDVAVALTSRQQSDSKIDRGGRHVFVIPWRGCSLLGTSYTELETLENQSTSLETDINQLIEIFNELLPSERLTGDCVYWAYHGLYPLRETAGGDGVYRGTGDYVLTDHKSKDGVDGLITALGAKFTTGRVLGQKTLQILNRKFNKAAPSQSLLKTRLNCSNYQSLGEYKTRSQNNYRDLDSQELINHLITTYGSTLDEVMDYSQSKAFEVDPFKPVMRGQPDVYVQIYWALENEMVVHLEDLLLRRTSVGLLGITPEEVRGVCDVAASVLQWDKATMETEIEQYESKRSLFKGAVNSFQAANT